MNSAKIHEAPYPAGAALLVPPRPYDPARAQTAVEEWRALVLAGAPEFAHALSEPGNLARMAALFGNSPFLTRCALVEPAFTARVLCEGSDGAMRDLIAGLPPPPEEHRGELMRRLRIAKRQAALAIALADIGGTWTLEQVTLALSDFASAAVTAAVDGLLAGPIRAGALSVPDPARPAEGSGYCVLGMGKLGARELNYSSDIDLIVLYDPERAVFAGHGHLSELFVRLTRDLIKVMQERTADGYVFRTDLRLRPDAGATPVAIPVAAAEAYYESVGQNWERAAMIKARPIAGDIAVGRSFLDRIRPFVWRRHLDFAAIRDVHAMTHLIRSHHGFDKISVPGHNIKLGLGGIREIEFFAQIHQLIGGGRHSKLREPTTLGVLRQLAADHQIAPDIADGLSEAYRFLRRLEHRLQMIADAQTHSLPGIGPELDQVATFMGFANLSAFENALLGHLRRVAATYDALLDSAQAAARGGEDLALSLEIDAPDLTARLSALRFRDPERVLNTVRSWPTGRYPALRSQLGRELLQRLTPAVLEAFGHSSEPDAALARFDSFLGALPAGVQLFSLFSANPRLLDLLAEIMSGAAMLAEGLTRHPSMLEAVLQPDFHALPDDADALAVDLGEMLRAARDFQDVLDLTRRWANERKFQVGVQLLTGQADGEAAGLALSAVAEATLRCLVPAVAREFAQAHGALPGEGLALLALGKLGAQEMTLASDLDLVIVYDAPEGCNSDGQRPLAPPDYYARLSKRIINSLTALTGEGRLYDVDMRLRPSGSQGPIAVSLTAFAQYQRDNAWTWERMALTRGRVVFGSEILRREVEAVVRKTVNRPEPPEALAQAAAQMRAKMAEHERSSDVLDVKSVRGGLIDLEFIAQFLILRMAHDHPEVMSGHTTTAFQRLRAAGALTTADAEDLEQASKLLLNLQHMIRLWGHDAFVEDATAPAGLRQRLFELTGAASISSLRATLDAVEARVRDCFKRIVVDQASAA